MANAKKGHKICEGGSTQRNTCSVDEHTVARMMKGKAKLVADVVAHVPKEISRFVSFLFKQVGNSIDALNS